MPGPVSRFQRVVCDAPEVRGAFTGYRPLRLWWRVILCLHGKPTRPTLPAAERVACIAGGFRFYGHLYRFLAVLVLAPVPFLCALAHVGGEESGYWIGVALVAAAYLWVASGLAYVGANAYERAEPQATASLMVFLVMVIAFLSLFLAGASVAAHLTGQLAAWQNVAMAASLFFVGVGSYLVEVVYIVTEGGRQ